MAREVIPDKSAHIHATRVRKLASLRKQPFVNTKGYRFRRAAILEGERQPQQHGDVNNPTTINPKKFCRSKSSSQFSGRLFDELVSTRTRKNRQGAGREVAFTSRTAATRHRSSEGGFPFHNPISPASNAVLSAQTAHEQTVLGNCLPGHRTTPHSHSATAGGFGQEAFTV